MNVSQIVEALGDLCEAKKQKHKQKPKHSKPKKAEKPKKPKKAPTLKSGAKIKPVLYKPISKEAKRHIKSRAKRLDKVQRMAPQAIDPTAEELPEVEQESVERAPASGSGAVSSKAASGFLPKEQRSKRRASAIELLRGKKSAKKPEVKNAKAQGDDYAYLGAMYDQPH